MAYTCVAGKYFPGDALVRQPLLTSVNSIEALLSPLTNCGNSTHSSGLGKTFRYLAIILALTKHGKIFESSSKSKAFDGPRAPHLSWLELF